MKEKRNHREIQMKKMLAKRFGRERSTGPLKSVGGGS